MYSRRIAIEGEFEVLSPFHPGSGEEGELSGELTDVADPKPRLAQVLRDVSDNPYLSGTAVKGVLRRCSLADKGGKEARALLFGEIKSDAKTGKDEGRMGRLTVYGGSMLSPGNAKAFPGGETTGLYVGARTAIDGASGTADEGKLFYQELIAPGACFCLRMLYASPEGDGDPAWALLLRLLKTLGRDNGVAFGKGQADGQGRLRLNLEGLRVTTRDIGEDGSLMESPMKDLKTALGNAKPLTTGRIWRLKLVCDGPFMVNDWSHRPPPEGSDGEDGGERIQLKAQRRDDNTPELPGSSLMGALRARAQWLARLEDLRTGKDGEASDKAPDPVERLFGTTGAAALLRLDRLTAMGSCARDTLTSVVIDRFSGGPIDNKLFTSEVFVNPVFEAWLSLDGDRAEDDDERRTVALLKNLEAEGLTLGHGANKGLGWFKVTEGDEA